jgi:peptidoglycan-associated lipoprotein
MKREYRTLPTGFVLSVAVALILGLSGCASSSKKDEVPAETGSEFSDAGATDTSRDVEDTSASDRLPALSVRPIYFDFDRSEIREDAVPMLRGAADQLTGNTRRVVIEGHCDNRGSEEYNLALGERRAASVRRYLANLGVPMRQMTIVSYGELRPAAEGNSESAWALNRRAAFESAD